MSIKTFIYLIKTVLKIFAQADHSVILSQQLHVLVVHQQEANHPSCQLPNCVVQQWLLVLLHITARHFSGFIRNPICRHGKRLFSTPNVRSLMFRV